MTSHDPADDLAAGLAGRLRDAHRRVAALDAPEDEKARVTGRLIALTDAAKHDLARASVRLDRLMADLDAGRSPSSAGDPPTCDAKGLES